MTTPEQPSPPPLLNRRATDVRVEKVEEELKAIKALQEAQGVVLATNTKVTQEIREILELGKAFFKLARWVGAFIKWATIIGAPILGLIHWFKTGELPKGV